MGKHAELKIKKGDTVKVIAGKDKGAEGKVIQVLREEQRVIVEGVNRVKKHTKVVQPGGRAGTTGGIITTEAPIHVSNVMLVEGDGVTRVGLPPRRGDQAPPRRLDVRRHAQRPRLPQDRQGDLMTDTTPRPPRPPSGRGQKVDAAAQDPLPRGDPPRAARASSSIANVMQVPGLTKIVVNMGVGEAARDSKLIEGAVKDLTAITGQKPTVTKARKSIAQFKLREGMPIGAHVTLRGDRMWEFLDRLLSLALPRIRDFRGLSPQQFDGQWQLHLRSHRAGHVPRDRPGPHRPHPRHGHHGRHHGHQRRRGSRAAQAARLPVQGRGTDMAKTALRVKAARKPKFAVRGYTRCQRCGRPKAVYRKFGLCRICLREMAHRGELPGVTKSSW